MLLWLTSQPVNRMSLTLKHWNESFRQSTAIITLPPNVSSQGRVRTDCLVFGSGTALVLKGWATRFHWLRIACRAPAHCPGPVRRYWYGVQGPKKTFTQSWGSLRSSVRRFGRTPTCNWKSNENVSFICLRYCNRVSYKGNWTDLLGHEIQVWDIIYLESSLSWAGVAESTRERRWLIHILLKIHIDLNFGFTRKDINEEFRSLWRWGLSTFSSFSVSQSQWPPASSP